MAGTAFHAKMALRNTTAQFLSKLQVLQITVFASMIWTAGTRQWTVAELRGIRRLQVRMTRRLGGWWPRSAERRPDYAPSGTLCERGVGIGAHPGA